MGFVKIATVSFIVAVIALYAHDFRPFPDYLHDANWRLTLVLHGLRPMKTYGTVLGEISGIPAISALNVTRALYSTIKWTFDDSSSLNVKIEDELFNGVLTRLYIPPNAKPNGAAIFNIHGGGWLFFDVPLYDDFCVRLAHALGVVVASVEYRMAPEFKYPTPLDDCEASLRHFATNAAKWQVDPNRIAILGDSCGGNLAAALTTRFKRKQEQQVKVKLQILFYPMLQTHNLSTVSYRLNENDYTVQHAGLSIPIAFYSLGNTLPAALKQAGYAHMYEVVAAIEANNHSRSVRTMQKVKQILTDDIYDAVLTESDRKELAQLPESAIETAKKENKIEELTGKEKVLNDAIEAFLLDPEVSPLLAPSVAGLPPTYFGVVGHDNLRHDSYMYAERLKRAGVKVYMKEYPDRYHPYALFQPTEMVADLKKFLDENPIL